MRTSTRRGALAVAALTTAALVLTACGTTNDAAPADASAASDDISTVLFDYPYTALPVYQVVASAAKARAAERGVTLELTNDNMDLSTQVSTLNTWLTKKPGAVVSFPMDPAAIENIAAGFRSQGSIWVTYGGDLENQDGSLQFSFYDSGYELGKNAGEWANAHLDGTGKALLLIDDTIQLGRERSQGIADGLAATSPGIQVVAKQQAITPEQGMSVTNSVLSQNADVNIVLAASGDAAQGAYQSLIASGRAADDASTYVGGLDGNLSLLQAMKRDEFVRALTTIDPVEIGNAVIDVPLDIAAGTLKDGVFNVDVDLVTRDYPGLDALIAAFGG